MLKAARAARNGVGNPRATAQGTASTRALFTPKGRGRRCAQMSVQRMKALLGCGAIACLVFCNNAFGQAQVLGKISGTITDSTGAVVPGARVTVTNKNTQQSYPSTTNDSGYYVVVNLPAGTYDVTTEKEGFERCTNAGVHLDPAEAVQVNCALQVGQVTQTVEVSAAALSVQTEESKVSRVINDTQIEEMPVNGRNFATLLALQPGVVQAFSFNSFQGMNLFATQDTHVNGLRGDSNNVQIEGSPSTRTRANGAIVAAPSIDAIGEINIVTTGYMPEYCAAHDANPQSGPPCPTVPAYLNGVDGLVAGQRFPSNTIPSGLWSSNGSAFVQAMAQPSNAALGSNFAQEIGSPSNDRKETIKIDYNADSIKSHLAVTLRHYTQDALPSWGTSGSSQLL